MQELHLKSFGCRRLNLIVSFWHGPYASSQYFLWPFSFWFFILGFLLHNIHTFHNRLFCFLLKIKIKNKKREEKCVLCYCSWTCNQGWLYYLYITKLISLDELILLYFTSVSYVVHVVWELFIVFYHMILILKSHVFDCKD